MDLNQRLIERNVACLLVRNCGAKGKQARPSNLERSDHFSAIAVSRLLLAPDPTQSDRLLLSHARNRHTALTPTLTCQIQPLPENPDLPHIRVLGSHKLLARDLLTNRPEALHRQYLYGHLLRFINETPDPDPIPVATLYAHCPDSSPFQVQRALSSLLHLGVIERPARGFYAKAPTNPAFPKGAKATQKPTKRNKTEATPSAPEPTDQLNEAGAIIPISESTNQLNEAGAIIPISEQADQLNEAGAITPISESTNQLNEAGATPPIPESTDQLTKTGATTFTPELTNMLNGTGGK